LPLALAMPIFIAVGFNQRTKDAQLNPGFSPNALWVGLKTQIEKIIKQSVS
jgi:hypothetical protein